jgi:hypothetical protein
MALLACSVLQYISSVSSYMVLNKVAGLTFAVVNVAKRLCIIVSGIMFYKEAVGGTNVLGVTMAVGGVLAYHVVKDDLWVGVFGSRAPVSATQSASGLDKAGANEGALSRWVDYVPFGHLTRSVLASAQLRLPWLAGLVPSWVVPKVKVDPECDTTHAPTGGLHFVPLSSSASLLSFPAAAPDSNGSSLVASSSGSATSMADQQKSVPRSVHDTLQRSLIVEAASQTQFPGGDSEEAHLLSQSGAYPRAASAGKSDSTVASTKLS